mmetsp:Transcript_23575/g.48809  ORF Transcript_23575/g.48809 Transcript_23575/m.48809 type:complete len:441 (+) Transcript_23575:197-1519(+)
MSGSSDESKSTGAQQAPQAAAAPKKKHPLMHLVAGGTAGFVESSICHPLDTIKTRMQLRRQAQTVEAVRARSSLHEPGMIRRVVGGSLAEPAAGLHRTAAAAAAPAVAVEGLGGGAATAAAAMGHEPGMHLATAGHPGGPSPAQVRVIASHQPGAVTAPLGPFGTAKRIVTREGFTALYKGLTAVWTGIVPKMAIRFVSFEWYREHLGSLVGTYGGESNQQRSLPPGQYTRPVTFFAGLASGLTEAVMVVTPAEVCKIRMQSQYNSMIDPAQLKHRKYTNVAQTAMVIVREEGLGALYKGVVPTMMRQGCNQAVNFTTYNWFKDTVIQWRKDRGEGNIGLRPWESLVLGGISGGFGPMVNNPLDVVKTRMQKQVVREGVTPKYNGLLQSCVVIAKEEGTPALWKGITPRLLRIMPGQAITFMTYEFVSKQLNRYGLFVVD